MKLVRLLVSAELNRAFASSPVPAPAVLVEPLLKDTADLAARLETRLRRAATDQEIAAIHPVSALAPRERRAEA